jgi:hypothetical protein
MFKFYRSFIEKQALRQFKNGRNVITDSGLISVFAGITLILFMMCLLTVFHASIGGAEQYFVISDLVAFLLLMFVLRTSHNIRKYAATAFKKAKEGWLFFEYDYNRLPVGEGKEIINTLDIEKRHNKVVEVSLPIFLNEQELKYSDYWTCRPIQYIVQYSYEHILLELEIRIMLSGLYESKDVINYFVRDHHERDKEDGDGFSLAEKFDMAAKLKNEIMRTLYSNEVKAKIILILKSDLTDMDYSLSEHQRSCIMEIVASALLKKEPSLKKCFSNFSELRASLELLSTDNPKLVVPF